MRFSLSFLRRVFKAPVGGDSLSGRAERQSLAPPQALDAWLGFVLEQKRKRRRVQRALEAYQAELLREGVSRVLGYTAGLKRLRGAAQTQQQLRVACHLHQAVYHCAMRWKQKALCQKHRQALPRGSPQKRVTFEMPVSTSATASGTAPSRAQSDHLDLFQAAGDSVFTELSAARQARLQPRRPDFLAESLERAEVPSPALGRLESPAGALQQLLPRCLPTPAGVLLPSAAKRGLSPSETDYSQLLGTSSWPQSSPLPRPELLPPSSFRPRVKEKPETATCSGLQPPLHITSPLLEEAWKEAKGGSPKGNLLLPRDFTRSKSPPTPPFAGRAGIRGEGNQVAPITKEATVHKQLKAELQCIGKKMRHYHNHQQELRLCRQQERLLSTWLEMRTGAETQADIWEVQESLAQLKGRITSLLQALGEERPLVQSYISHLQDLRAAFGPKAGSPPRGAPGLPLESRASLPSGGAALRR